MVPFRNLNDFILDSKKYSAPSFSDLKRLNNRVISNLLYYQTNYFALSAIVFSLFLIFGFNKIFLGAFGIATTGAVGLFALDRIPQLVSIRAQYPIAVPAFAVLDLIVLYCTFRPILFFSVAILVPIGLWIVHAAVRSRGLKNKVNNKMEQLGAPIYANSPMGMVLSTLGLETKDFEE